MILLYIFLAIFGFLVFFVGSVEKDDAVKRKDKFKGLMWMAIGFLMMLIGSGGACTRCDGFGDGYSVSKELNEVTGQPRDPFPFNH